MLDDLFGQQIQNPNLLKIQI